MNYKVKLEDISIEHLYKHILAIEGIKHHDVNPKKLDDVADYIFEELKSYGLEVSEQVFTLEGMKQQFRNIEAVLGEGSRPEILITSHYDTVENSPGANDNGSGVAGMLEAARVLAKMSNNSINIRFVSFTLEELHPVLYDNLLKKRKELGLVDEHNRYTNSLSQHKFVEFQRNFMKLRSTGKNFDEASKIVYENITSKLIEKEKEYVKYFIDSLKNIQGPADWIGKTALVGSAKCAERLISEGKEIIGVINLETIGYTSKQAHSQRLPSKLFKLLPKYKVNMRKEIGNFIAIVGETKSKALANNFFEQCKKINLPAVNICLPMDFETLATKARDLLRSDHAAFWQHGIPALMITDTANFRYPFYHTEADTIDKLDFDFIRKVCLATITCAIDFNSLEK